MRDFLRYYAHIDNIPSTSSPFQLQANQDDSPMLNFQVDELLAQFDPVQGAIAGGSATSRTLSAMRGYYADEKAFAQALAHDDSVVYSVASVAPDAGEGALHFGIGRIEPGRIGAEYFMTKGHLHEWRPAAEYYIGLGGSGVMLLEDEEGTAARMVPLTPHSAVYVPGHTAHRTINTGEEPLIYLGIYPALAGHDYGAIAERNFRHVVIAGNDRPIMVAREDFLRELQERNPEVGGE
jgi:glucose-6-phosphate isomerase